MEHAHPTATVAPRRADSLEAHTLDRLRHAPPSRWCSAHERAVVLAAQQGGERERERLVEVFMAAITGLAWAYRRSSEIEFNEFIQDGVVGLLRALERFDPDLGVPFWAYASWWVRQAMQQLVSERSRPSVLSDRAFRQLARIRDARGRLEQSHRTEPSCRDLATAAGLTRGQVQSLLRIERAPRGLDEPAGGQTGAGTTVGDLLADPLSEEPYENAANRMLAAELPRLLGTLSERERTVICARYGIGASAQTLREVADTLGVSAERVRQIEAVALERLSEAVCA